MAPQRESHQSSGHSDNVGYEEYRQGLYMEVSEKDNSRVRWKIDLVVLPIFLITQMMQYLDRAALNYANLFGYQEDLNLKGQQFNYITAILYAGYFLGQYPCSFLIGRFPAQHVVGTSCFVWGLMVIVMTQCYTYSSALAARFIMGLFEAAVTPGLTLMTGFWYTRQEIPLRQCIWYSAVGWGGITGSYIAHWISQLSPTIEETLPRWELLFYILGGITCLWAFVIILALPDSPSSAFFLTKEDRIIAVKRVVSNQTGIKNKTFKKNQVLISFADPKIILLFVSVFGGGLPGAIISSFSTVILKDMGFSNTKTTEMKSVGDAVQIVALLISGTTTLNVPNSRLLTATAANIVCTIASACLAYLPREQTWGRLISFWITNSQSVSFTISLVTISSNMAGYTHRSIANGIVFTAHCWGNFSGPFTVKESEAPAFRSATIGMMVGYVIKMTGNLCLLLYLFLANRHRNLRYGPADKARSDEAGMQDLTEFENKHFRYVL